MVENKCESNCESMEIHRSSAHNNDVNECCCCQMTANKEFYNELEKIFKTTKE